MPVRDATIVSEDERRGGVVVERVQEGAQFDVGR